jgi:hypothetical protein
MENNFHREMRKTLLKIIFSEIQALKYQVIKNATIQVLLLPISAHI